MVVDFHTHYTGGRFLHKHQRPYDVRHVLNEMDTNGIEMNLLLPKDGFFVDCERDNDGIIQVVAQYPERFVGTGTVNPRFTDHAVSEMKRCLANEHMIGMKFHPWLQAFSPLDTSFMLLAEEANHYQTMFFFHDGTPPYTEPLQIAEVARRFPNLTVVLGHSGLHDLWREALAAAQRYDNIWLCFCCCPYWGMQKIAMEMAGERILWGSDYPMMTQRDVRDMIRQVEFLSVSDEIKEKILYGNAKSLIQSLRNKQRLVDHR